MERRSAATGSSSRATAAPGRPSSRTPDDRSGPARSPDCQRRCVPLPRGGDQRPRGRCRLPRQPPSCVRAPSRCASRHHCDRRFGADHGRLAQPALERRCADPPATASTNASGRARGGPSWRTPRRPTTSWVAPRPSTPARSYRFRVAAVNVGGCGTELGGEHVGQATLTPSPTPTSAGNVAGEQRGDEQLVRHAVLDEEGQLGGLLEQGVAVGGVDLRAGRRVRQADRGVGGPVRLVVPVRMPAQPAGSTASPSSGTGWRPAGSAHPCSPRPPRPAGPGERSRTPGDGRDPGRSPPGPSRARRRCGGNDPPEVTSRTSVFGASAIMSLRA